MKQEKLYLGTPKYIDNGIDMAYTFHDIAKKDEEVSKRLFDMGYYNHAVYFLIQSMEKYVKHFICKKIDINNPYFANKIRDIGHSIDKSIEFLVEIIAANDETMKKQIDMQIRHEICRDIKFSKIHNAVRYPDYSNNHKNYKLLDMSRTDYNELCAIYIALKKYLKDMETRA